MALWDLTFDGPSGVIPAKGGKDCDEEIGGTMKNAWRSLAIVCALVIGVYAYTAHSSVLVSGCLSAADNYYNLLV